jgi:hypothetical protein
MMVLCFGKFKLSQFDDNCVTYCMRRRWTQQEILFLIEHYNVIGAKGCVKMLKMPLRRIRIKASRLKIIRKTIQKQKYCVGCSQTKLLTFFSPHRSGKFGVQSKCMSCRARWESHRKKTDKQYRLIHSIRNRIRMAIKKNIKSGRSLELLGCDIHFFKDYISQMFKVGMSWDNHGKWHIDHIRPCSSFDLSKPNEQKACFHYSNLQPLWKNENLKKGSKV